MPKRSQRFVIIIVIILSVGAIGGAVFAITSHPKTQANACAANPTTYEVSIKDSRVLPITTMAHVCDKLKFTNYDNVTREISFGPHEDHIPYDGVAEKTLNQNQSFTIVLNQTGLYHFHDHLHDEVMGYFNVTAK